MVERNQGDVGFYTVYVICLNKTTLLVSMLRDEREKYQCLVIVHEEKNLMECDSNFHLAIITKINTWTNKIPKCNIIMFIESYWQEIEAWVHLGQLTPSQGPAHIISTPCWCLSLLFLFLFSYFLIFLFNLWQTSTVHLTIPTTPKVPVSQTLLLVKVKTHVFQLRKYPDWYTAGHVIIHREREKGLGWFWEIQHIWQFLLPSRGPKCFAKRRDDRATPTPCSLYSHALTHSLAQPLLFYSTHIFVPTYFVHTYIWRRTNLHNIYNLTKNSMIRCGLGHFIS